MKADIHGWIEISTRSMDEEGTLRDALLLDFARAQIRLIDSRLQVRQNEWFYRANRCDKVPGPSE